MNAATPPGGELPHSCVWGLTAPVLRRRICGPVLKLRTENALPVLNFRTPLPLPGCAGPGRRAARGRCEGGAHTILYIRARGTGIPGATARKISGVGAKNFKCRRGGFQAPARKIPGAREKKRGRSRGHFLLRCGRIPGSRGGGKWQLRAGGLGVNGLGFLA